MQATPHSWTSGIGFKIGAAGIISVLLLVPLQLIHLLIAERNQRKHEVVRQLGEQWGQSMTLRGPILVVPTRAGGTYRYLLPESLRIDADVPVEERYRSIFRIPTYRAELSLQGSYALADLLPEPAVGPTEYPGDDELDWAAAQLLLLVAPHGQPAVRGSIEWAGRTVELQVSSDRFGISGPVLHAAARIDPRGEPDWSFAGTVEAYGSQGLHIAPLGKAMRVTMSSDWPHPSFDGARIPTRRSIDDEGFEASWELSAPLLGLVPSHLGPNPPGAALNSPALGVRFIDAVSHYRQVTRGVKYAILIIVLTFVAFFLFEMLSGLSIHPVQYLLVGCALILFYLLLLSLSEHLSFGLSYLIAAGAVVLLVAAYARAMLRSTGRASLCGAGIGGLYGLLYVILQEERLALLAGAWTLFAMLALVMYLTRNVDWSKLGQPTRTREMPS